MLKNVVFIKILKSNYCKAVWVFALFASYFLIPHHLFKTNHIFLAIFFMLSFAMMLTCLIRNIKEKIILTKTYQSSVWGIFASILGLTALQLCGLGGAFCGGSIFLSLLSMIFPGLAISFFSQYAVEIIIFSIFVQILAIWQMGCLMKKNYLT